MMMMMIYVVLGLTRNFPPGESEFFRNHGLLALLECLKSGITKLTIKSLFLLSYYYTTGTEGMKLNFCKVYHTIHVNITISKWINPIYSSS